MTRNETRIQALSSNASATGPIRDKVGRVLEWARAFVGPVATNKVLKRRDGMDVLDREAKQRKIEGLPPDTQ